MVSPRAGLAATPRNDARALDTAPALMRVFLQYYDSRRALSARPPFIETFGT
jgi:hypothetical protein